MDAYLPPSRIGKDYAVPDSNGSETGSTGVDSNPPARKEPASGPRKARALSGANEMTDKTELLVALAEVLPPRPLPNMDYSYEISPLHAEQMHIRFNALAEALAAPAEGGQPAGAVGDAPKGGLVDGFDTWFDEYSKQNYDDYMLARAAWNASPTASVDVDGLLREIRADAIAFATADTVGGDLPAMRRAMQRLADKIDSAGGAKE